MLKQDKKVFIVLNHQLSNSDDKIRAVKKINQIISTLAPAYNVSNEKIGEISIFPMNVRTAYSGQVKEHEKLLERSGYNDFIEAFKQWTTLQDKEQRHLDSLKNQINDRWYDPVIEKLDKQVNTGESKELRELRDDRLMLESEKRSIKTSAAHFINQQVNQLKTEVSGVLSNSNSELEIDTKLQEIFMPLTGDIEDWLGKELSSISEKLIVTIDKNARLNETPGSSSSFNETIANGAKEFLSDQKNLKEALLLGRKLKIPVLKGRWEKTFDKWVGKAAPAIKVATFLYDLYKADSDQNRENSQNRQRSMELYQCVDQICSTVIGDLTKSIHDMVDFTFDSQIDVIQQQLDVDCQDSDSKKSGYNELMNLKREMFAISF